MPVYSDPLVAGYDRCIGNDQKSAEKLFPGLYIQQGDEVFTSLGRGSPAAKIAQLGAPADRFPDQEVPDGNKTSP
jgi:hypothetical protein